MSDDPPETKCLKCDAVLTAESRTGIYRSAKLRGWARYYCSPRWGSGFVCPDCRESSTPDRITALEARNRALEEALRSAPHDFVSGCDADDGYHECNCYKAALDA